MDKRLLENLGKNIKKYRLASKLTQDKLAEIVGIHPTYVGKFESSKNNPSIKMIYKITRSFKISLLDIFDFDKN